ncbi:hypothetical protein KEM52_000265, partial [Ascosphaera acerosa]
MGNGTSSPLPRVRPPTSTDTSRPRSSYMRNSQLASSATSTTTRKSVSVNIGARKLTDRIQDLQSHASASSAKRRPSPARNPIPRSISSFARSTIASAKRGATALEGHNASHPDNHGNPSSNNASSAATVRASTSFGRTRAPSSASTAKPKLPHRSSLKMLDSEDFALRRKRFQQAAGLADTGKAAGVGAGAGAGAGATAAAHAGAGPAGARPAPASGGPSSVTATRATTTTTAGGLKRRVTTRQSMGSGGSSSSGSTAQPRPTSQVDRTGQVLGNRSGNHNDVDVDVDVDIDKDKDNDGHGDKHSGGDDSTATAAQQPVLDPAAQLSPTSPPPPPDRPLNLLTLPSSPGKCHCPVHERRASLIHQGMLQQDAAENDSKSSQPAGEDTNCDRSAAHAATTETAANGCEGVPTITLLDATTGGATALLESVETHGPNFGSADGDRAQYSLSPDDDATIPFPDLIDSLPQEAAVHPDMLETIASGDESAETEEFSPRHSPRHAASTTSGNWTPGHGSVMGNAGEVLDANSLSLSPCAPPKAPGRAKAVQSPNLSHYRTPSLSPPPAIRSSPTPPSIDATLSAHNSLDY